VIEHVQDPEGMLEESARILRRKGLLVIITPDPFMEKVASAVGLPKEAGHQNTFSLKEPGEIIQKSGFAVLDTYKFMFSPVGFPAEKAIEKIMGLVGLEWLMANQMLVARKL